MYKVLIIHLQTSSYARTPPRRRAARLQRGRPRGRGRAPPLTRGGVTRVR